MIPREFWYLEELRLLVPLLGGVVQHQVLRYLQFHLVELVGLEGLEGLEG